jgi:hypothetical protein
MKVFSVVAMLAMVACSGAQAAPTAEPAAPAARKKVLVQSMAGPDDPSRAVLAFVGAFGIAEAGHDVTLVLAGDAAGLLNDATAEATVGKGIGTAKEWFPRIQKHEIPVFV